MDKQFIFIYITAKDKQQAMDIGEALLVDRLIACFNILDNMRSGFWWQDIIDHQTETVLIAKSKLDLFGQIEASVKKNHSYSCPCIIAMPIIAANADYLQWIDSETKSTSIL